MASVFGEPPFLDDTFRDLLTSDLLDGTDGLHFDLDDLPPLQATSGVSSEAWSPQAPPPSSAKPADSPCVPTLAAPWTSMHGLRPRRCDRRRVQDSPPARDEPVVAWRTDEGAAASPAPSWANGVGDSLFPRQDWSTYSLSMSLGDGPGGAPALAQTAAGTAETAGIRRRATSSPLSNGSDSRTYLPGGPGGVGAADARPEAAVDPSRLSSSVQPQAEPPAHASSVAANGFVAWQPSTAAQASNAAVAQQQHDEQRATNGHTPEGDSVRPPSSHPCHIT